MKDKNDFNIKEEENYINENGYTIRTDGDFKWHGLYELKTGELVQGYRYKKAAIKKAKELIYQKQVREIDRVAKLKETDLLVLCSTLKYKLPAMNEILCAMRENHNNSEASKGGYDVSQQLLHLNGDLNLIQTRLENLRILIKRMDDPDYGLITNEERTVDNQ